MKVDKSSRAHSLLNPYGQICIHCRIWPTQAVGLGELQQNAKDEVLVDSIDRTTNDFGNLQIGQMIYAT